MQTKPSAESTCIALFERYRLIESVKSAEADAWQSVWSKFEEVLETHPFAEPGERNVFIDLFFSYCLGYLSPQQPGGDFWSILEKWFNHRKPFLSGNTSTDENAAAIFVTLKLRDTLRDWLLAADCSDLLSLGEQKQNLMLNLWRQVFFDMSAPHNMLWDSAKYQPDISTYSRLRAPGFPGLLAASMYFPLDADDFAIDCEALPYAPLPLSCKTIIICWMINIPYFNGDMKHRDRLVNYVPKLCAGLLKRPEQLSIVRFVSLVQEIMTGFWRASYIGGNNLEALSSFGDFIHATITRLCPNLPVPAARKLKPGDKIRVGYISRNVFRQAVPYYMINRVIHHDRSKFEVFVFSLAERTDDFTEIFMTNCDHFSHFTDLKNFAAIINSVLASKLDILIFTDIGMDVVTYTLSGLRMAPIQCALVGHGTTSGMPTIDYYLSGDFEAENAENQYREKLIRLPNAGAAQYLPEEPVKAISREELGIPPHDVVFISCANGIKHRAEREKLYIEILRQAPNAWILLKPYTTPNGIDARLVKRFRAAAGNAGVGDRLLILPSIGHYRSVLGLLSIADVQLDTYPYGGWTTNMEALFTGLPIVTQEGELSRSRWGAGMLKTLWISEGIAANEEEFVAWAVKFAQDKQLRLRISQIIKTRGKPALFNGPDAQPAFEQALFAMLEQNSIDRAPSSASPPRKSPSLAKQPVKQIGPVNIVLPKKYCVATSISPRNYPVQQTALDSWRQAGFHVLALNPAEESDSLQAEFPGVEFIAAQRDARKRYKNPYVYFDDLLGVLAQANSYFGGIINSDIHLLTPALFDFIAGQPKTAVLFGSRFDAPSPAEREGKMYHSGFDYFFFHKDTFKSFPRETFCLGLPWWDFWAALIPLKNNIALKRIVTPAVLHVAHSAGWGKDAWLDLGRIMSTHFPAPFPLSDDTMLIYLNHLAQRINSESKDVLI